MKTLVYLVGAGPGDPELLTIKAKEIIEFSDVIIYDSLINPVLLEYTKKNAEIVDVGKRRGKKKYEQKEINELLISYASKGFIVARLKGGDPFVFGRGGEEAIELGKKGIKFEIVPGVSSVNAVPAYAGIPLTHRDYNSSFTVLTGHEDPNKDESMLDWKSLSEMETLVILMSLGNTRKIMKKLLRFSKAKDTPVSITSCGTTPDQNTITGTLSDISDKLASNPQIKTPAVTIVGNIVDLRERIKWYENSPLFGKKVLITRERSQIPEFRKLLNSNGAYSIEFPTIEIAKPDSYERLDNAITGIGEYDLVIFTSANGVDRFFDRLNYAGSDSRVFGGKKLICIGSKTSIALKKYGLSPDYIPENYVAEGILDVVSDIDIRNKSVLIPRAESARDILPVKLSEMGAKVNVIPCYKTIIPKYKKSYLQKIRKIISNDYIDVITFTSSSTVNNFFEILGDISLSNTGTRIACIGPVTAETVRLHELTPDIIAEKYTIEGIVDGIIDYYIKSDKFNS